MTDREKLRNLIGRVQDEGVSYVDCFSDDDKPDYIGNYELADYLLAHGVRICTLDCNLPERMEDDGK